MTKPGLWSAVTGAVSTPAFAVGMISTHLVGDIMLDPRLESLRGWPEMAIGLAMLGTTWLSGILLPGASLVLAVAAFRRRTEWLIWPLVGIGFSAFTLWRVTPYCVMSLWTFGRVPWPGLGI